MKIKIRMATPDDVKAISCIEHSLQGSHAWSTSQVLSAFTDAHVILVTEVNAAVVGYSVVQYVFDEAELHIIGIDRRFQRQGFANKLLRAMYQELKHKQVERLFLEVRETNHAAIALYKKHGFDDVGRRKNYYVDRHEGKTIYEDALVMSLTL